MTHSTPEQQAQAIAIGAAMDEEERGFLTNDQLQSIIHTATHRALPPGLIAKRRARIQVEIADFIIGAVRAREAGAESYEGMYFHD